MHNYRTRLSVLLNFLLLCCASKTNVCIIFSFAHENPLILHFRYLSASALEEYFAGKDGADDIKKAALDVCLYLTFNQFFFINLK